MKYKYLLYLCILLFMTLAETLPADEIGINEFHINDNLIEIKNSVIRELEVKVAELNKKLDDAHTAHLNDLRSQSEIFKMTFDRFTINYQSSKDYLDHLSKFNKTLSEKSDQIDNLNSQISSERLRSQECENQLKKTELMAKNLTGQVTELNRTVAAYSETIREQAKNITELKTQIDLGSEKMNCDNQLNEEELKAKIVSDQVTELNRTVAANLEIIKEQNSQLLKLKSQIDSDAGQMQESQNEIRDKQRLIGYLLQRPELDTARKLIESEDELKECLKTSLEGKANSCIPFGTFVGRHKIKVPGLDSFTVLCEDAAVGPGWIVIQQRINGKMDFYQDFASYRNGFGYFDEDFFLGLEKIHRLTTYQQHELYIHLERFSGEITYATYDNFFVAGEDSQYALTSIGEFSGNETHNQLEYHVGKKFYTLDRDSHHGCTYLYRGGWWYDDCAHSNLNGKYFDHQVYGATSNFWNGWDSLKKVQMLIRPVGQVKKLKTDKLLAETQVKLDETQVKFNETQKKLDECVISNLTGKVDSCIPFAKYPGIRNIKVPDLDTFDVLCGSAGTEPGWILIQQRIDGKENFYRDFDTYRAGFGSFEEDFFLGLEKIHRLTTNQQHELYIYMERFNGKITNVSYDHFAIAGEAEQYKLTSLGKFSGNTSLNKMEYHKGLMFYTFDRDNSDKCASRHHAGWWFKNCTDSNLNGKFFDHKVHNETSIYWHDFNSLKKVQMLIRPKFD